MDEGFPRRLDEACFCPSPYFLSLPGKRPRRHLSAPTRVMDFLNTFVNGVMSPAAALQNAFAEAVSGDVESEADASARAAARKLMFEDIDLDEDTHTDIEKPDYYYEAPSSSAKMQSSGSIGTSSSTSRGLYGDKALQWGRISLDRSAFPHVSKWKPKPLFYSRPRDACDVSPYLYREQESFTESKRSHLKKDYSYASAVTDTDECRNTAILDCQKITESVREIENMCEHLNELESEQEELKRSILPLFGHAFIKSIYTDSVWIDADSQRKAFEEKYCEHDVMAVAEISNYRRDCLILARKIQSANSELYAKLNRKYLFRLVNKAVEDVSSLRQLSSDVVQTRRVVDELQAEGKQDRDFALELRIEVADLTLKEAAAANAMSQMQRLLLRLDSDMRQTVRVLQSVAPRKAQAQATADEDKDSLHAEDVIAGMPAHEQALLEVRSEVQALKEDAAARHGALDGQLAALRMELAAREKERETADGQFLSAEGQLKKSLRLIEKMVANEVGVASSAATRRADALAKSVEEQRAAAAGVISELHNAMKVIANVSQEQARLESCNRNLAMELHQLKDSGTGDKRDTAAMQEGIAAHARALVAIPQELRLLVRGSALELKGQVDALRDAAVGDRVEIQGAKRARETLSSDVKKCQGDIVALSKENSGLKEMVREMRLEIASLRDAARAKGAGKRAAPNSRQNREDRVAREAITKIKQKEK